MLNYIHVPLSNFTSQQSILRKTNMFVVNLKNLNVISLQYLKRRSEFDWTVLFGIGQSSRYGSAATSGLFIA